MELSDARFSKYKGEHERETQCMKLSDATFSKVNLPPIALGHVQWNMSMRQCMKLSDAKFSIVNLLSVALGHVQGNTITK